MRLTSDHITCIAVEVRYYVKEGKNFGIKLPVDSAKVVWKFFTTSGGSSKNKLLDSDSDKLVIYDFKASNEGMVKMRNLTSRTFVREK